jgi:uracil-DNA glycosylase
MTLKEVQQKLYENLKESGWGDKLKMFILSQDFYQILETLYQESQAGNKFTPVIKDLFRAFQECPYDQLKVVVIGQDPYPQAGVADGISFSCSYTGKAQPSLRYIFKEIDRTVYSQNEDTIPFDPDLKRWSNQGVLMLNTALTCRIGKIGSHIELWKPFIVYLLDMLSQRNQIVYVFLGNKAKEWHTHIPNLNYKFFTTHPASAAYRKGAIWDSGDLFNNINKVLLESGNTEIKW